MKALTWRIVLTIGVVLTVGACNKTTEPGAERGAKVFKTCVPCHGADGGGNETLGAPSIAGMPQWYVEAQLVKFRDGARGDHPDDIEGLRMGPMARTLDVEGDVESVAEHVASIPAVAPDHTLGGDAAAGQARYMLCMACHGPDGKGNQDMNAPGLVGQDDWYLARQIDKFKKGIRGADPLDRTGATMAPMAATLPDDKAIADVIAYIGTLQ